MSAVAAPLEGTVLTPRPARIDVPGATLERIYVPESVEALGEIVAAASATRAGLLIVGGRTRLGCARPSARLDHGLATTGLNGVDEFEPDEGVLHAAAGTPIAKLREVVASEGWELPLDPPGRHATLGGTIATAATGPRAQAFGRVSDAILGLEVVDGEGVVTKCGGRVVKNVTGYDLAKLHCGAYGSLGVITGAWLRLRPAAAIREVHRGSTGLDRETFERVRAATRLATVRAIVWIESDDEPEGEVVIELGGSEAGVAHDRATLMERFDLEPSREDRIDLLRDARAVGFDDGQSGGHVRLRARVLGSRCAAYRDRLRSVGAKRLSIDPGLGVLTAELDAEGPEALDALRAAAESGQGLVVFERLPEAWRSQVDVFGEVAGTEALLAGLKARFDPADVLNPGRLLAPPSGGSPR